MLRHSGNGKWSVRCPPGRDRTDRILCISDHVEPTESREDPRLDDEAYLRTIEQVITLFVWPEITRRLEANTLDPQYIAKVPSDGVSGELRFPGITLVLLEENKPVRVLFDGEAEADILCRVKLPANVGDEYCWNDMDVAGYRLSNLPPNSGYLLLLNQNGLVSMSFDFRYNCGLASEHLSMGQSFLTSAEDALARGDLRVCFENLFHSAEKLSKSILLTIPTGLRGKSEDEPLTFKSHAQIRELYERFGNDGDGQALLAELGKSRNPATYFTGPFDHTDAELAALVERTKQLRDRAKQWVPDRMNHPPERRWELSPSSVKNGGHGTDGEGNEPKGPS